MISPLDIRFLVEGVPLPKGSMSGFPISRGRCTECKPGKSCRGRSCFGGTIVGVTVTDQGGKELEAWQGMVFVRAISARNAAGMRQILRPNACEVSMVFVMPRPDGHWTATGQLTADGKARAMPTVKPDLDKMARAALDGITRSLVEDDSQVVAAPLAVAYAGWKCWTGVSVHARQISSLPDWAARQLMHHGVWSNPAQGALL